LIDATRIYVERLIGVAEDDDLAGLRLNAFLAEPLASGAVMYFEPYEAVHQTNVEKVRASARGGRPLP